MILYIGGQAQGKLELALRENNIVRLFDGAADDMSMLKEADCIYNLHSLIRRLIYSGEDVAWINSIECSVVICNEVGCGIVPIEPLDIAYREAVGRCCCELAKKSERVVRVVCGIGMDIK
jgi:adenosyl cobinamide kinase/adenosyl cobinamide phosphate guanylyltransferase